MEQQPKAIVCAPEVLPVNRDQLRVCVKCLTPIKTPKQILHIPNAKSTQWEKDCYVKVIASFLAGSQGEEMKVSNVYRQWGKNEQQKSFPLQLHSKGEHFKEVLAALILLCSCWFTSHRECQCWEYGLVKWEMENDYRQKEG